MSTQTSPEPGHNPNPNPNAVIEADENPHGDSDADSTFSDASSSSFSASLTSSILNYRVEHGRTYHSYREGKYAIPNDDTENDRLDLQHALFSLTLDGKLHLAPVKHMRNCLDVGTGTGIWAIDLADEHPEANVLAIDLSPIQPAVVPPNLKFLIDDVEDEWTYKEQFDFIHARMMVGSFNDWPKFLANCMAHLAPGGWVELQDVYELECDDGTLPADSALARWYRLLSEGFTKLGRPITEASGHKRRMIEAGFVDVQEVVYKWPLNTWPKDKKMKKLGLWSRENTLMALEGLAMAPLTRALGWRPEEVQVLAAQARNDMLNLNIHAYWSMYFVYGRKPDEE